MKESLEALQVIAEKWKPEETLRWAFDKFGDDVEMATGFGVEGMVLLDIAHRVNPNIRVFTGDTEFLFPETYDLIDRVEKRYGIKIERLYSALTPEEQDRKHGAALWKRDPDQCCKIRKVEPLKNKLAGLRAWITAIRRDQTADRSTANKIEWDNKFQLVKVNPIADWTKQMVWDYVHKYNVPYNPLHDRNYPSIGCTHCTRAVQLGEDARAGRWSGFQKTECGLHVDLPQPLVNLAIAGKS
ncbi:MAG TPA: phosphoadenylyl-sulfate reductase [Terriglobales bacterium]|nr:phosphoadenylyl-sulfate reductase [Terriglobales bacterium]